MATATAHDLNDVTRLSDRLLAAGKQFSNLYLDGYEQAVARVTAAQRKLAAQSPVEGVQSLIEAQADLTSQLAETYTAAARKALA